ncbi:MAG: 2Fe-2S iron-sulfur cluster-binding protein, partial [Spirochaetales bacterium]|nr:2Fe-2S iron-sulfur cluster-binding protein [Spirochaetales bacterium]
LPDAAFADDFRHLASEYPEGFRFFPISMESEGIITVDTIKRALKNSFEDVSFFICGPPALHDYILGVLESCSVRRKFIRRENFGRGSRDLPDPVPRYNLTLQLPAGERQISARSDETILTALERAGVNAPSSCRGGDCGFCRSRLVSGDITFDSTLTGVRLADRKFGWIHPCVSYPEGDLVIKVPENP